MMFWWTEASVSCINHSVMAIREHAYSASSPTRLHMMGAGRESGEPDKYSIDTLGPTVLEDLGWGLHCRGLAPTTSTPAVPYNTPPPLSTSDTDTIIGRLGDVTEHIAD
jgi:hypothetical protein